MSRRSSRGSVGTAGPDDNGDAAWAAEMHERQHVPLPDGIALPAGTQLFVSRRDARKYSEADREGGPVTVMQNVAADVSHKFRIKSIMTPAHKYDVDRSFCSISRDSVLMVDVASDHEPLPDPQQLPHAGTPAAAQSAPDADGPPGVQSDSDEDDGSNDSSNDYGWGDQALIEESVAAAAAANPQAALRAADVETHVRYGSDDEGRGQVGSDSTDSSSDSDRDSSSGSDSFDSDFDEPLSSPPPAAGRPSAAAAAAVAAAAAGSATVAKRPKPRQFTIRLRVENGKCRGPESLLVTVNPDKSAKETGNATMPMLETVIGQGLE
jgi:hypothetical protein